jgi:hypothetical protein
MNNVFICEFDGLLIHGFLEVSNSLQCIALSTPQISSIKKNKAGELEKCAYNQNT